MVSLFGSRWLNSAALLITIAIVLLFGHWFSLRAFNPALPAPALKELAKHHNVSVGNYASLKLLGEAPYKAILTSQYSFVSVDGELNWAFNDGVLRPAPDRYDFTNPDKVMAFAHKNNFAVQGHHLVWGEEKWLPAWLKNGNYTPDQLMDLMHQHINQVAGHYKGQMREWSVVNEPFTRLQHLYGLHDWWADHTGGLGYIDQAFIWARQADPNAKLLLNDFGNESINSTSDITYSYVKGMKQRGVPIDGIGMQMHIDGAHEPDKQSVIDNMRRLASLGVDIYVTELDVQMSNFIGNRQQKNQAQAKIYYDMASACVQSTVCHSFAELGVTDKDSWYNELGFQDAWPLPFDEGYQPKPAYFALRQAFQ